VDLRINGVSAVAAVPGAQRPVEVLTATPTFYKLEFDLPSSNTVDVSIVHGDEYASKSFAHPLRLGIADASPLAFEKQGEQWVLTLRVKGFGFGERPQASVEGAAKRTVPLNSGEAVVELTDPPAVIILTLTNPDTGASATTVVTRPPKKEEPKTKKEGEGDK
jgi:hypothetical protein